MRFVRGFVGAFAAMLVLAALAAPLADADQTYTVTRTDDPIPGSCDVGDCSLREAVIAADTDADSDTINLPSGNVYSLSIVGGGDEQQGDLDITHSLFIQKTGAGLATVYGNGGATQDRIFDVLAGELQTTDVRISGGVAPADGDSVHRGGDVWVHPAAAFVMHGGALLSGMAPSVDNTPGLGGGVYNEGRFSVNGTYVAGNSTLQQAAGVDGLGGAFFTTGSSATTSVRGSIVTLNNSGNGGAFAAPVFVDDGRTDVTSSEINDNTATASSDSVGGAALVGIGGNFSAINSTFDNNQASKQGGAIFTLGGSVGVQASTITANTGDGGGIAARDSLGGDQASVTLSNSILAKNFDTNGSVGPYPDCYDETDPTFGDIFHTLGYNIIGNNTGCALHAVTGDQLGTSVSAVDPLLATDPAFNGGPLDVVFTYALQPTSTAIDKGDPNPNGACDPNDAGVSVDQRGVPRTTGGRCDIGAYEFARCGGVVVNRVGTNQDDISSFTQYAPTSGPDGFLGLGGDDTFGGAGGADGVCGGAGNDDLGGGAGSDHLLGGSGNDSAFSNSGNDVVSGGSGNDVEGGGPGNDKVKGNRGKDKLMGQGGNDTISGGPGPDRIIGGPGHDVCFGGPGHDTAKGCEVKHSIP